MSPEVTIESRPYLASFEHLDRDDVLTTLRRSAFDRLESIGLPTISDEEWRYTNTRAIATTRFVMARGSVPPVTADAVREHLLADTACHRFVFVNGVFVEQLSDVGVLASGAVGLPLGVALANHADAVETNLGRCAEWRDDGFAAWNTASVEDGAFLLLPRNAVLDKPVHLLFLTVPGPEPLVTHPRILVVAEACSQATIVESYASLGSATHFTNAVTELVAGEDATIDHYKVITDNESAQHVSHFAVHQSRASHVTSHNFTTGGALVRNNVFAALEGEGCDSIFNGLYLPHGRQLVDNHLRIEHRKPHCRSWEFYKGVLDDAARAVFSGRIYVAEDAQKTDAKQTNMNLLLSDAAHVDTKPQLEIFADDVKCTHGATIGQIEESQLFYLRSRGIDTESARNLLIYAFANETISEVRVAALRRKLEAILRDRLPHGELFQDDL